jgi:phosphatidylglycerophosphate synthase
MGRLEQKNASASEIARERHRSIGSLPNLISFLRVPLGLAFFATEVTLARVLILAAAAATDYLDGWAARTYHHATHTGEIVDPLTDKFFTLCVLAALLHTGALTVWQLALLLSRDAVTVIAFWIAVALRLPIRFRARMSGKIVTGLQIATVFTIIVVPSLGLAAVLITAAAGAWAIFDYLRFGARSLRSAERSG